MNLIQTKQVQGLDQTFTNLSGALNATGDIIVAFMSGDTTFSGTKTFTGEALFGTGVTILGDLTGNIAKFEKVGINLDAAGTPAHGVHISGADILIEDNFAGTEGGNVYVSGILTVTGQNGVPAQIIPEWIRNGGALYQTGLEVVNVGFNATTDGAAYTPKVFNVSGDSQVVGDQYISGSGYITGNVTGSADAYFQRVFITGDDGSFQQLSGAPNLDVNSRDSKGNEGNIQYKTGSVGFTGKDNLAFDPDNNLLSVGGPATISGLLSGSGDASIIGAISGASFHSVSAGTKYFSGNSNVEIIADGNVIVSGATRTEVHNEVPYYKFEEVGTSPHIYDLTLAIEGYRTDVTAFQVGLPQPAITETGQQIILKDITGNAGTNIIEVTGIGCTIDGGTGAIMSGAYESWTLFSDGNNWFSLGKGDGPSGLWVPAPATYVSPGSAGKLAHDASYLYVCTGTNLWGRASLAAW